MLIAGRYRLDDLLGRGGMGEVWRGWDQALGRQVAVKVLLGHGLDHTAASRFAQEAQTTARLSHPNVVAVYDFGHDQGRLYLVMEFVDGPNLSEHLTTHGPLGPDEAARLGAQAAAGLAAAHRQDVVHRDIKPANLLLAPDGSVKVADFGIARLADQATAALTSVGTVLGTSAYLAPERALGHTAGPASDIYALGCVLHELLTGHPPFSGDNPAALLFQHVQTSPMPVAQLRPEVPAPLSDLVMQMLAKDPDQRPDAVQSARWLDNPLPRDSTVPMPVLLPHRSAPIAPPLPGARRAKPSPRRPRRFAAVAVTAVTAVLAVVIAVSLAHSGTPAAAGPATTSATPSISTTSSTLASPSASPTPIASRTVPAPLSDDPAVLLTQLARQLRTASAQGDLDPALATDLQNKITQAQANLAQGRTNAVRDRVRDISHQLTAAAQHQKFTSNATLDRLLSHLSAEVGATQ